MTIAREVFGWAVMLGGVGLIVCALGLVAYTFAYFN